MASMEEIREKERRAREFMVREGLESLALSSIGNFAWATCGGQSHVSIATETGGAAVVFTREARYIVCDNIEARRIEDEEVAGQGFEFRTCLWFESRKDDLIREIAGNGTLGSDTPMAGAKGIAAAFDPCRYSLTPEEVERYQWLGRNTGECLAQAAREIEPGMTEHQIASMLNRLHAERGMTPVVTLIAADERIAHYRHPIPTDKTLERCAMLVTSTRRWGLVLSATRMVHFGPRTPELRCRHEAVAQVDAALIAGTRPGANVAEVFRKGVEAYKLTGFREEWRLHHQGGPTGYKGREFRATEQSAALVAENQAFAWNPSITGTKTEDTIIATPNGPIILSGTDDWPTIEVEVDGQTIRRPEILIR